MKNTSVSFLFVLLISVCLIFALVTNSLSCSIQDDELSTNPDSVIASAINRSKIVMLGEPMHHDLIFYNGLINVLNNWLQICDEDKSVEFTLNLVMEMDSLTAFYIDQYIKTGVDSIIYSKIAPYLYMEDIECYASLRKVGMEIESLNEKRNGKIALNILGFEEAGNENDEILLRMNQRESEKWFINDRDKNISIKLIDFIKSHDNSESYLVYYGAAHLSGGYVNKNFGFSIPVEESYGYYLLYYLKQEFGVDSVSSFVQLIDNNKLLDDTFLKQFSSRDVLVPSNQYPIKAVEVDPNKFIVVRHIEAPLLYYNPHLFRMVFSSYVIEKLSERTEILEKCLPGYKATQFYLRYLQSVSFITGERFENSTALRKWIEANPDFDGLQMIDSKEHCSFIYELSRDPKSTNYGNVLRDLGFDNGVYSYSEKDSAYLMENWKTINRKAKFINAIGIYWIGHSKEKENAKKYLFEFTGEDHSEAQQYLKWFRKKYFNYER